VTVVGLVLAAALFMLVDSRLGLLGPGRAVLTDASAPFYWLGSLPGRMAGWLGEVFASRDTLVAENRALRAEALVLRARAQRLAGLSAENLRLRELLNSTALLEENVLVSEIIGISPDPGLQIALIDKGSSSGVQAGQAVIDASGLFGQVIEAGIASSRVLLITDSTHAVPAQVLRNGVRVVVEGNGRIDRLDVDYVAPTMDVRPGDLLVSSGLGQRFPGGYPVGVVESVTNDPGEPFSVVSARPSAQLDRSRHILVLINPGSVSPEPMQPPALPATVSP
jgi:rod shape-determining protein MreC